MIRVAICNRTKDEGLRLQALIDRYTKSAGIENVDSLVTDSCSKLLSLLNRLKPNMIDVVVCRIDRDTPDAGRDQKVALIRNLTERSPETRFILMSSDPDDAICAYDTGALYLGLPVDKQGFYRTIGMTLEEVAKAKKRPFCTKSSSGVTAMNLNDISFVEISKKGPIIHLPHKQTVSTRGTLQALHDQLSSIDGRFVRAGGSFIVNLDNMRSIGDSTVVFGDGETIILPTRARKVIRDVYTEYLTGA